MIPRIIFATVEEARDALRRDALGTIYQRASTVFVATAHGTGTFLTRDWNRPPSPDPTPDVPQKDQA